MSHVPIGPPMSPPETMPTIAEATASVAADGTPASSNSGANANPVAGPPVSVTDPASTPSSGGWPSSVAMPRPSTFCAMAASVEATKKSSTSGPPMRSSARLAPKPTEAKNAFCSGVCSVVSKPTGVIPALVRDTQERGHEQAADDRRRDVVPAEQRDRAA